MTQEKTIEIIYGKKSKKIGNSIYIREEDLEIPHGEDYKLAIEELKKIQYVSISGKTIPQLFQYENISLWWFIYQSLVPKLKKSANFVEQFLNFLETSNTKKIIIFDFTHFDLIKQICNINKIQIDYSKIDYFKFKNKNKIFNLLQKKRYDFITQNKVKDRKQLFLKKTKTIPSVTNKLLFAISTNFRRSIFDFKDGKSMRGEFIQDVIMDMFAKDDIVGIDLDYTFRGQPDILLERMNDEIPWFPVEMLLESTKKSNSHHNFIDKYHKLINDKKFHELFQIRGISLWEELKPFFKKMTFTPYLPFYLELIDSISSYFLDNKPKAVFLPYETGPIALAIISAFRKLGIKTIGVQHGYIYPYSPMYSQTDFVSEDNPFGYPIPDVTLLFGNYVKNQLVSTGYPSEKLLVYGNPSLFNLDIIKSRLDKKIIKKKLSIKNDQNIILFTTGKLQGNYTEGGKYDYDEQIWEDLLKNFGGNENFYLILKPHPSEKNISIYHEIMNRYTNTNARIIDNDIFELIQISSIIVSVFSSTMFDALCFNKPVIRIKFDKEKPHLLDGYNVVLTTELNNLSKKIIQIINDSELKKTLEKNSSEFIKNHYGIPEDHPENTIKKLLDY